MEEEVAEKAEVEEKSEQAILDACIKHAKEVLAEQLPHIEDEKYDFAPQFKDMTIQLYLVGVMWRFYTQYATKEDALEKAYAALFTMMVKDGVKTRRAKKQAAFIKDISQLKDGDEALALVLGYESEPGDTSLAEVFDHYLDEIRVSGGLWRFYDQGKKIIVLGGLLFGMAGVWFVTVFMPESENLTILAIGLLMAFLFIAPVSLIGLLLYRYKIKKGKNSKPSAS